MSIEISKFIEFVIAAFTNYVTGFELDRNGVPVLLYLQFEPCYVIILMERKNDAALGCYGLPCHCYVAANERGKLVPACVRNTV